VQGEEVVQDEAVAEGQEEGEEGVEAVLDPAAAQAQAQEEIEMVTEEVTTEVIEEIKPFTIQGAAQDAYTYVRTTNPGKAIAVTGAAVLVGTFALACYRYWKKFSSPKAHRQRQLNKNGWLVQELSKVLPDKRSQLNASMIGALRLRTGFNNTEIFRKYLWFLLRERKFDQAAVEDMVALKHAAGLKDEEVAEAVRERAQRIYDKYGTLMVNTDGFTAAGVERKATCRNLFRKLLYLTEHDPLLRQGTDAALLVDLHKIMGVTEDDMEGLRIVSLYDVDLEKAFNMPVSSMSEDEGEQPMPDASQLVVDVAPADASSTQPPAADSSKPGDSKQQ